MRVAIVSDPMSYYGGAERVLEQLLHLFPNADLFALVDALPDGHRKFLGTRQVRTSFLQHVPASKKLFRKLLPIWPLAIEMIDVSGYDLVISSQHAVAHGVITSPSQFHVVYTHSPMRYAWDLKHQYLHDAGLEKGVQSFATQYALHLLRSWDAVAAQRPDGFIANSQFVSERIRKYYRRDCSVVHPPVSVTGFNFQDKKESYYVSVGRLVPYKRCNVLVDAFRQMPDRKLVVIGSGPELKKLQSQATPNVFFLGFVPEPLLRELVANAQAMLFAGIEDFGISLVEAQAAGTPVIGFNQGGLVEIIQTQTSNEPTGFVFDEQTADSVIDAIESFERLRPFIAPLACRNNSMNFSVEKFRERFLTQTNSILNAGRASSQPVGALAPRLIKTTA
jgi:glycosyltransferase involved in cell wall biosynthesis